MEDFRLHVPDDCHGFTESLLSSPPGPTSEPPTGETAGSGDVFCLAPTAQWGCKCWPIENFAELAAGLLRDAPTSTLIVLAAPGELDSVQTAFAGALPQELLRRVHFPRTSVGQMMDVIAHARLLVGNDSAPLHLAVGLDTPSVSIFGPTDPALVGPPPMIAGRTTQNRHRVIRAASAIGRTFNYRRHRDDNRLIAETPVSRVADEVRDLLSHAPPPLLPPADAAI